MLSSSLPTKHLLLFLYLPPPQHNHVSFYYIYFKTSRTKNCRRRGDAKVFIRLYIFFSFHILFRLYIHTISPLLTHTRLPLEENFGFYFLTMTWTPSSDFFQRVFYKVESYRQDFSFYFCYLVFLCKRCVVKDDAMKTSFSPRW